MYEGLTVWLNAPVTCQEVQTKVDAFRTLFDEEPLVFVTGIYEDVDGKRVHLPQGELLQIEERYLLVRSKKILVRIDPNTGASAEAWVYLQKRK